MGWPGWHVPPLGLWNFHQPVKELKSAGKIFIKCPYDFASEVRYAVNLNRLKKCATPEILPQIRLWVLWYCVVLWHLREKHSSPLPYPPTSSLALLLPHRTLKAREPDLIKTLIQFSKVVNPARIVLTHVHYKFGSFTR